VTPRAIAEGIVAREGGFVNDPDDAGGATNRGVTIHTMRRLKIDLDHDGDIDIADVRLITPELAVGIFLRHYFERPRIAKLPEALQATVFDMYVNAGVNAVKILQRLLNDLGLNVSVDGVIGPNTLKAVRTAFEKAGTTLVDAYGVARRNYYFRLADRKPSQRKYARTRAGGKGGWIKRAEEFISPKYRMSDAEFQERISGWV